MNNSPNEQVVNNQQPNVAKQAPKSQKSLITILFILVFVLFGIIAYLLITEEVLQTPIVNTKTDEQTEDFGEDEISYDDETEENESEETTFYNRQFPIFSNMAGIKAYFLSADIPLDAKVINKEDLSTEIQFGNSLLNLTFSEIAIPETVSSYTEVEDANLPNLYRLIDQADRTFYSTNLQTDDCVGGVGSAPCASKAVKITNNDNNLIYVTIEFIGEEEDLSIADKIVNTLGFKGETKIN